MLFVFGCHDYGNEYFCRVWIWISYENRCCYLTVMGSEQVNSGFNSDPQSLFYYIIELLKKVAKV
jgi:hypothetical protein